MRNCHYEIQHRIQWLGGGGKKHEIYGAAFGGHLSYDLFLQGWGPWAPSDPLLRSKLVNFHSDVCSTPNTL